MKPKHIHCLTLRIQPQLDEALTEACWDHRTTKATWIRAAIRRSLGLETTSAEKRHGGEEAGESTVMSLSQGRCR